MSEDKHRETQLRGIVVSLAKAHWKPSRVMTDKEGRAVTPERAGEGFAIRHILIREDGWSIGASTDMLEAAEGLWPDEWLGRVDLVNSHCVEAHVKSTHDYWVSLGFASIETGEPCAKKDDEDQARSAPKGKTLEDLRDFLRKGIP